MASHYLISKVFPEWRLNPGFGIKKECPFPLNRGVPSIKITNTNIYVNIFPGPNFVSLEWRCSFYSGVQRQEVLPYVLLMAACSTRACKQCLQLWRAKRAVEANYPSLYGFLTLHLFEIVYICCHWKKTLIYSDIRINFNLCFFSSVSKCMK